MKSLTYALSGTLIAIVSLVNSYAEVAKPQLNPTPDPQLPAVWNSTTAQERLKALRVAQLDAYRALLERVYGFEISSGTSVYDCTLQSDKVSTSLNLLIKGAAEMEKPQYTQDGMVMVVYGLKLRKIIEVLETDKAINNEILDKTPDYQDKVIEALGCGALPGSKAMKMLRAKRAAELDAYRLMAERLVGLKINSETTIADLCLKSDRVQASLVAFLKGLKPTAVTYKDDNSCAVTMQLKIREVIKTVEKLVRVYNSGNKDKITNTDITTNDKIFTVTGHGAPRSEAKVSPVDDIYRSEKNILREVIKKEVVIE